MTRGARSGVRIEKRVTGRRDRRRPHRPAGRRGHGQRHGLVELGVGQLEPGVADVLQPPAHVALQTAAQQPANRRRRACRQRRPRRIGTQHGGQGVGDVLAAEDALPREHFEQHDAERPDVAASVGGAAARLFRTHIGGRAQDDPGAGHRRRGDGRRYVGGGGRDVAVEGLGQSEVEHFDGAVGPELDVGRLQVAMDDALRVGRLERIDHLRRNRQCLVERQRACRQAVGERWPVDQLEHQRRRVAGRLEAIDRGDVGMVQRGQQLGFAAEPHQSIGVGEERRWQHLQRHVALQRAVAPAIDLAHPAFAELGQDVVGAEPGTGRERHRPRL
jgi:hypothetical protein